MKQIDPKHTADELVAFVKTTVAEAGFSKVAIALSGGVDSGTCMALAVAALGRFNVYPRLLPYGALNAQGTRDGWLLANSLSIPKEHVLETDIQPLVDPILAMDPSMDAVRGGNVMARIRMTILFDQAKKLEALVVGTENKSEHLLGYFTRYGDSASDIEPLRNLYKTQVFALARHLGLPESILGKPPSAGLWKDQTDEGDLGFTYREADEILSLLYDEEKTAEDVIAAGFSQELVGKVATRVTANVFKHRVPYVPEEKK